MGYRDDRDALQGRVQQLEEELEDARKQGEEHGREEGEKRADELARRVEQLQRELGGMQNELTRMRRPRSGTPLALSIAGFVVVLASVAFILLARGHSSQAPPVHITVGPSAVAPSPPAPRAPEPPAPPAATATPEVPRSANARWTATITRSEGIAVSSKACFVDATIETPRTNARVASMAVTCGGRKIYDSTDSFNGSAQMDNDARERLGPGDEQSTFTIQFDDIGTRTGRAQIQLDSTKRLGVVFSQSLPPSRVELAVAEESVPGPPLSGKDQRLRREGKVTDARGTTVKVGATCVLRAMPTGFRDACVADVTCEKTKLFPTSAPVKCTYEGARPTGISSDGGKISLDYSRKVLTLHGEGDTGLYVVVALDE